MMPTDEHAATGVGLGKMLLIPSGGSSVIVGQLWFFLARWALCSR